MKNKAINLDVTAALYRAWLNEPVDWDIDGRPISRRSIYGRAGALESMINEATFAAGYAASLTPPDEVIKLAGGLGEVE